MQLSGCERYEQTAQMWTFTVGCKKPPMKANTNTTDQ